VEAGKDRHDCREWRERAEAQSRERVARAPRASLPVQLESCTADSARVACGASLASGGDQLCAWASRARTCSELFAVRASSEPARVSRAAGAVRVSPARRCDAEKGNGRSSCG
jgi:hypothetical protein